jgi:hypothetical protein
VSSTDLYGQWSDATKGFEDLANYENILEMEMEKIRLRGQIVDIT